MRLTVLGARGSMPVEGESFKEFGGATTSFLVETAGQVIFVDAGTGILSADSGRTDSEELSLLITHPHLDHLLGLPFFKPLSERGRSIAIYGADRVRLSVKQQIDGVFKEPYWPAAIDEYAADIKYHQISYQSLSNVSRFDIGDVRVSCAEVPHPGGSTAFKIEHGGASIVVATDAELPPPDSVLDGSFDAGTFAGLLAGADVALIDGQYDEAEAGGFRGYGHSTPVRALEWAKSAGVKRLIVTHHSPAHDDIKLREMELALKAEAGADIVAGFARAGDVIEIKP